MNALKVIYDRTTKEHVTDQKIINETEIAAHTQAGWFVYADHYRAVGLVLLNKSPWKDAHKKAAALKTLGVAIDDSSFSYPIAIL